jgi:hypothetical protein
MGGCPHRVAGERARLPKQDAAQPRNSPESSEPARKCMRRSRAGHGTLLRRGSASSRDTSASAPSAACVGPRQRPITCASRA